MKTTRYIQHGGSRSATALALCVAALGLASATARAQGFNFGIDGTFEDVVYGASTNILLPADGILRYRSLQVASGVTVTFTPNARNTPVFILAQSNVVVNGNIVVDGARAVGFSGGIAGPGGFNGGQPGFSPSSPGGDGYGPGGGRAGAVGNCAPIGPTAGGYAVGGIASGGGRGESYGNDILIPLVGGSGGGGSTARGPGDNPVGGGGGGGAILIASNTRIEVNAPGGIFARGGAASTCHDGGSGGAIRLLALTVAGNGRLDVSGGGGASQGRVRVDTLFNTGVAFDFVPNSVRFVGANLLTFPPTIPTLRLIEAGGTADAPGTAIAENDPAPRPIFLPIGSTTNRTVKLRARDFGRVITNRVTLTPHTGPARTFDAVIDNTVVNPAEATVDVIVPVNTQVTVHCWTL